ncbi:transcriptional regulator, TetR family [Rhizobiales bacterium GAS113]|nr:transcriptional regulator, TetR family [Rhizobiales bacterium GAS113]
MTAKTKIGKRRKANAETGSAFYQERPKTSRKATGTTAKTKIGKRREANADVSSVFYQERRKAIVDAAAAAFQERGYEATALADVAEKLKTDRASLYYYFGSKEQLFQEVVREGAQRTVEFAEAIAKKNAPAKAKLTEAFRAVMGSYSSTYPYMHVFLQGNFPSPHSSDDDWTAEAREWASRYYYAIRSIIQQGVDSGSFKLVLSVGLTTMGVLGTVNWAHRWFKPGGKLAAEDIGEGFADMILNGLVSS